jgi:hypothetical protein
VCHHGGIRPRRARGILRPMATWGDFRRAEPELASFGEDRLKAGPAYLATVRAEGRPRVFPVQAIVAAEALYLFMEPT